MTLSDILFWLVVGSYLFTAAVTAGGIQGFLYLYRMITNHMTSRLRSLELRVDALERAAQSPSDPADGF